MEFKLFISYCEACLRTLFSFSQAIKYLNNEIIEPHRKDDILGIVENSGIDKELLNFIYAFYDNYSETTLETEQHFQTGDLFIYKTLNDIISKNRSEREIEREILTFRGISIGRLRLCDVINEYETNRNVATQYGKINELYEEYKKVWDNYFVEGLYSTFYGNDPEVILSDIELTSKLMIDYANKYRHNNKLASLFIRINRLFYLNIAKSIIVFESKIKLDLNRYLRLNNTNIAQKEETEIINFKKSINQNMDFTKAKEFILECISTIDILLDFKTNPIKTAHSFSHITIEYPIKTKDSISNAIQYEKYEFTTKGSLPEIGDDPILSFKIPRINTSSRKETYTDVPNTGYYAEKWENIEGYIKK